MKYYFHLEKLRQCHGLQLSQWRHSMQVSKSIVSGIFALALTTNEMLTLEILYLQKVGQGHGL